MKFKIYARQSASALYEMLCCVVALSRLRNAALEEVRMYDTTHGQDGRTFNAHTFLKNFYGRTINYAIQY